MIYRDHFQNYKGYAIPKANAWLAEEKLEKQEIKTLGFAKTRLNKIAPTLWQ